MIGRSSKNKSPSINPSQDKREGSGRSQCLYSWCGDGCCGWGRGRTSSLRPELALPCHLCAGTPEHQGGLMWLEAWSLWILWGGAPPQIEGAGAGGLLSWAFSIISSLGNSLATSSTFYFERREGAYRWSQGSGLGQDLQGTVGRCQRLGLLCRPWEFCRSEKVQFHGMKEGRFWGKREGSPLSRRKSCTLEWRAPSWGRGTFSSHKEFSSLPRPKGAALFSRSQKGPVAGSSSPGLDFGRYLSAEKGEGVCAHGKLLIYSPVFWVHQA